MKNLTFFTYGIFIRCIVYNCRSTFGFKVVGFDKILPGKIYLFSSFTTPEWLLWDDTSFFSTRINCGEHIICLMIGRVSFGSSIFLWD